MHYGYWEENTPNLRTALSLMNQKVAEFGSLKKGDKVLDAGCGVGGSSIYLARHFDCKPTGISLSDKQIEKCRENAEKHGVANLCTFDQQNYLETPYPDHTFDVVWAIESVCYAFDKLDFLKEAYRILKPGGRLVVADFFVNEMEADSDQAVLVKKWTETWAIQAYANKDKFYQQMNDAGFVDLKKKDISKNVLKTIRRLFYAFLPGIVITSISQALGFRNRLQTANTWSTYYQYQAYKMGLWSYMFFSARKPT